MKAAILIIVVGAVALATYRYNTKVDVVVSADPGDDLCGAYAVVKGDAGEGARLKARGSRFARTVADLEVGTGVLLCEEGDGWHGVIVRRRGMDCLNRDDRLVPRPYTGPCVSGWLPDADVELIAG